MIAGFIHSISQDCAVHAEDCEDWWLSSDCNSAEIHQANDSVFDFQSLLYFHFPLIASNMFLLLSPCFNLACHRTLCTAVSIYVCHHLAMYLSCCILHSSLYPV